MIFASVSPDHFEGTIEYGDCRLHGEECYGCAFAEPDREVPYSQHNEPNPILVAYREDKDSGPVGYVVGGRRPSRLEHWIAQIAPLDRTAVAIGTGVQPSTAHIDHARRVLTRLANLSTPH
ncbi:hypothetical protein BKA24_001773 [Microbacterium marinum]|uniref:Uncharacterized protein n=1 Tax=Microbacterium marinum TaxID=421115 RepID=A0A7W7BQN4_9MICO|nr:hypothetical protein [Microbacterium marinum]MBB4667064.1 hypothetical protein [Microbacterium marinum]